jgi:signal transduction histidine kinase
MARRAEGTLWREGAWAILARRLSPFLDPGLGVGAAVLAVASLLLTEPAAVDPRLHQPDAWAVGLTAATGLSLLWRRRRPRLSFGVFVGGALLISVGGYYIGLLSILLLLSLYSLATHGRRGDGLGGLAIAVIVFVALALAGVPDLGTADLVQAIAVLVTAWAVGDAVRSRRTEQQERLHALRQEAAAAREQVGRAAVEERLRIARELHDVVAHSMSLIAVQAGVGAHLIHEDIGAAERALEVIAETSRQALQQTRLMLGPLRLDTELDRDPTSSPARSTADLPALAEQLRQAGVDVQLTVSGPARPLGPAAELAIYRIVQESLTNVLKHSGAPAADVRLTYSGAEVTVSVEDAGASAQKAGLTRAPASRSGPAAAEEPRSPGHGLLGLRERAAQVGGRLEYQRLSPQSLRQNR